MAVRHELRGFTIRHAFLFAPDGRPDRRHLGRFVGLYFLRLVAVLRPIPVAGLFRVVPEVGRWDALDLGGFPVPDRIGDDGFLLRHLLDDRADAPEHRMNRSLAVSDVDERAAVLPNLVDQGAIFCRVW